MTSYASDFASVQASVIAKLRLDTTLDADRVKEWVNQVYSNVASSTRCLQTSGTAAMTAGDSSYTMPADVLYIEELTVSDGDGVVYPPIVQTSLDDILRHRQLGAATMTGEPPLYYTLVGLNQLEFWPAARPGDVLTFWYTYLPDELVNDDDVSVLPEPFGSKLLEYGALVEGADFKNDLRLYFYYQTAYANQMTAFQSFLNRRAGDYPRAFQVWGDGPNWVPNDRSSDWYVTGWRS